MTRELHERFPFIPVVLTLALVVSTALAQAPSQPQQIPNMGQQITPLAPVGAQFQGLNPGLGAPAQDWLVSNAVTTVVSPDHKTMLILTSGYNRFFINNNQPATGAQAWYGPDSNEYVFIYDISTPTPVQKAVVQMPTAYSGIVFDPSGSAFYAGGCAADYVFVINAKPHHGSMAGTAYRGASLRPQTGPWPQHHSERRNCGKQPGRLVSLRRRCCDFEGWPDPGGGELLQRFDFRVHWRRLANGRPCRDPIRASRDSICGPARATPRRPAHLAVNIRIGWP